MTAPVDISPEAVEGCVRAIQLCAPLEPTFAGITVQQAILTLRALRSAMTASEKLVADLKAEYREEIKQMQKDFREELRDAVAEAHAEGREWTGYGN